MNTRVGRVDVWPFGATPDDQVGRTERNVAATGFFLFLASTLGLLAVLAYGWSHGSWMLAITSSLIGGASYAVGWVVGFLFGIPRSRADEAQAPATAPAAGTPAPAAGAPPPAVAPAAPRARARSGLRTNTNLQDVSDWLTKLLLGAGLTQLNSIPGALGRFGHNAATALLGPTADPALRYPISVFVQATVVYFAAVGFLAGYLVTRLFLAGAFSDADRQLDELKDELETEKKKVETEQKKVEGAEASNERLRSLVEAPSAPSDARAATELDRTAPAERLAALVREYNTIRKTQASGPERTREMTRVFRQMMEAARESPDFDVIQRLDDRDRGWRLAAYAAVHANPRPEHLEPLVRSLIRHSAQSGGGNKPFCEYWGIEALDRALRAGQAGPDMLNQLLSWARGLEKGSDRLAAMTRILQRYGIQI